MGIRYKLLVLLFFIALVPLLVVSFRIQNDLTELGEGLVARSSNNLVRRANSGLKRLVEDHARLLQREKQLLEANTQFLASKIEGILYGHEHSITDTRSMPPAAQVLEAKNDYYLLHMHGFQNLEVDFNFFDTNRKYDPESEKIAPAFNGKLLQIMRQVKFKYPELVLWIEVKFSGEYEISYPKSSLPMHMRHLFNDEINSRYANELTWSLPQMDKRTRRLVFNISTPIKDEKGAIQGEITIVVPVSALLHKNQYASMFSGNAISLIVNPEADPVTKENRLRVIAQEQDKESMQDHWVIPAENTWLMPEHTEQYYAMMGSLQSSTSGVTEISYEGKDTLWAYAPIDRGGVSLMTLVPKTDIVKEAQSAKEFILAQIDFHNRKMGYTAVGVAIMVLMLAFLLSKLITRNIFELVTAVGEIAKGNFTARVSVRGKDEISQLGLAFNQMIPKLKERVNLKNALEVAQQVQQNLLPTHNPKFHGADIAAISEYYYETGGDYYGFIPRQTAEGESLVIAVGDVSGHGIPAALMMCSARAYIRCQATAGGRLDDVVKRTNELVAQDVDQTGRFMTLFLLELTESRTIRWVRAGHDPAFVFHPSEDRFEELSGEGLPLGVIHNTRFEMGERSDLSTGRIIVIGTDGIWEMLSPEGEMFGKERLKDVIRTHKDESSAAIIRAVVDTLTEFRRTAGQIDDLTIAVIKTS
jgi:sigma-B regulation protein RsbU (phosphoserine phosphatase)